MDCSSAHWQSDSLRSLSRRCRRSDRQRLETRLLLAHSFQDSRSMLCQSNTTDQPTHRSGRRRRGIGLRALEALVFELRIPFPHLSGLCPRVRYHQWQCHALDEAVSPGYGPRLW